jgi:septum formation protein
MQQIVLASASPRRAELLRIIVPKFDIMAADIDESVGVDEPAPELVMRLATQKAQTALSQFPHAIAIGSDTVISKGKQILGKPTDKLDFLRMMQLLSGGQHEVLTGLAVVSKQRADAIVVTTKVNFAGVSESEALKYWQTKEPIDKAGGYAIQGIGAQFVQSIHGSYTSVVGLPLYETKAMLESYI